MTRSDVPSGTPPANLSEDRRRLFDALSRRENAEALAITRHVRDPSAPPSRLPISWAQQRLWFIDQLEEGSAGYHIQVAIRIRGDLSEEVVHGALDTIFRRHEALRTIFARTEDDAVYGALYDGPLIFEKVDLSNDDAVIRERKVIEHRGEAANEKFNLQVGPLMRNKLLRLGEREHVLVVTIHHIVADGWSVRLFLREFFELYVAFRSDRDHPLTALPVQYADYAQWQQRWLQAEQLESQLRYWRKRLEGADSHAELPTDRARPAVQSYRGRNMLVVINAELTGRLRNLARRHEMTVFMVLYAGWALLLARLTRESDIVIGTPIANRQRQEVESLIGFFVNTLVLRLEVHSDCEIERFLMNVKAVTLGAYDHQDVPFEKIVEMVRPERSLSRNPLFQVMLALQNTPTELRPVPGLDVTVEREADEPAVFDIFLSLEEKDLEIVGSVNYATDLFDQATIDRWMASFAVLLSGMAEAVPERRIGDLPILSEAEFGKSVHEFNSTRSASHVGFLVNQLFEEQVERTPDVSSVVYGEETLTYMELNSRSNQLARYLRGIGVATHQVVGLCMERSIEMLVGVMGIVKAGAACLPLDPNYPRERLHYMLVDAAPRVVLTHSRTDELLRAEEINRINLSASSGDVAKCRTDNLRASDVGLSADNWAYFIYTSGSTGRPKGVAMAHRALANLTLWHLTDVFGRAPKRVLQFAALNFDVAFQEIFTTLCAGGTIVMIDEWKRRDSRSLAEFIAVQRIQRLFIPPLMLQGLAECFRDTERTPDCLDDVITAGEQLRLTPEMLRLFGKLERCRVHNHYGPSETHVVTALTLGGKRSGWPVLPTIGRPISGTQIYVLSDRLQPMPIGALGEIYIGGVGLAEGYLGKAALTAERFVANPFDDAHAARLYRTGDLGRWQDDGALAYVGRNDDQVKLRGYRIELGEIEAQLSSCPGVKEVAVVVRENEFGERRLVAYLVCSDKGVASTSDMRSRLSAQLPEYMIPSAFCFLESLPSTPNGKLDRRALPVVEREVADDRQVEAPRGAIERAVATIWERLLRLENIGRYDNFFELGGHSLLATRVSTHVGEALDVDVPIRILFEKPTLEGFSSYIATRMTEEHSTETP